MTVKEVCEKCKFTVVTMPDGDREIKGCYIGDLLSWVMGRAKPDDAWITIMSNMNIAAVASLADVSCIILSENVEIDDNVKSAATDKDINILSSPLPSYETAVALYECI